MSNTTNPEAWAAQERLRFIERSLWWRAEVKRKDLRELFGISLAQASSDLQRYLEMNPAAARYDLKAKRYRGEAGMSCLLHEPRLSDALGLFSGGGSAAGAGWPVLGPGTAAPGRRPGGEAGDRVAGVSLPAREAGPRVERAAFRALWAGSWLRLHYASLSGRREAGWRRVAPRAFAHDGYRWHLRAWCEDNGDYRDFVLSRVREAEWPGEEGPGELPPDLEWETFEELALAPNPELPEDLQRAVAADYGMEGGTLRLRVRRAMRGYALRHLGLAEDGFGTLPPLLVRAAEDGR